MRRRLYPRRPRARGALRRGARAAAVLAFAAAPAALLAGATAAVADTVHASSGGLAGTLVAGTHTPTVNVKWPIRVSATYRGAPVRGASAYYQFLLDGVQVSKVYVNGNAHFRFNGSYSDPLLFPPQSEGFALTVRVVVGYGGATVYLPYTVRVAR